MDGVEPWHVAPIYGGTGAVLPHDKTIINRIMLRFRPIAPKPATTSSVLVSQSPEKNNSDGKNKRLKRKYVRVRQNNNNHTHRKSRRNINRSTLQLLPEKSEMIKPVDLMAGTFTVQDNNYHHDQEPKFSKNNPIGNSYTRTIPDRTAMVPVKPVIETWITVECISEYKSTSCMDLLGKTDKERITNLTVDTCPGFISDGGGRVQWVNEAYKRMVRREVGLMADHCNISPEMKVWLVMEDDEELSAATMFTCRARLKYTWQKDTCSSKIVPTDAWRLDYGGFAWRLDVKAALSLGI